MSTLVFFHLLSTTTPRAPSWKAWLSLRALGILENPSFPGISWIQCSLLQGFSLHLTGTLPLRTPLPLSLQDFWNFSNKEQSLSLVISNKFWATNTQEWEASWFNFIYIRFVPKAWVSEWIGNIEVDTDFTENSMAGKKNIKLEIPREVVIFKVCLKQFSHNSIHLYLFCLPNIAVKIKVIAIIIFFLEEYLGLPWCLRRYRIHYQCRRPGFDSWVGKILWRREWLPTPVFLPGEFQGQRSLVGCSPWGLKESAWLSDFHFHFFVDTVRTAVQAAG